MPSAKTPPRNDPSVKEVRVRNFKPSRNGFQFANRFPGVPLPEAFEKVMDTSNSAYGLCGGMCFTVIDHYKADKPIPKVNDIPGKASRLYDYLSKRQWASWGTMNSQVLRYINWMGKSDEKAQADTAESWEELRGNLDENELTVIGLVYNDFRETVRVWDNHQVLAYGYSRHDAGTVHIFVYDPNYPQRDDIYIQARPVKMMLDGKESRGFACAQFVGDKKKKDIHGFLVVPYEADDPPDQLEK